MSDKAPRPALLQAPNVIINPYRFAGGGGTGWGPADLTLKFWLDAQDTDSIATGGTPDFIWYDQVADYQFYNPQSGYYPAYSANQIGSYPGVDFTGGTTAKHSLLMTGLAIIRPTTYAYVVRLDSAVASGHLQDGAHATARNMITNQTGAFQVYGGASLYSATMTVTGTFILLATFGSTSSLIRRNGASVAGGNAGLENISGTYGIRLMSHSILNTQYCDGAIGEVIACANTDTGDLEKIEGYLAHRWGLTGNLPAGHTYKSAPP